MSNRLHNIQNPTFHIHQNSARQTSKRLSSLVSVWNAGGGDVRPVSILSWSNWSWHTTHTHTGTHHACARATPRPHVPLPVTHHTLTRNRSQTSNSIHTYNTLTTPPYQTQHIHTNMPFNLEDMIKEGEIKPDHVRGWDNISDLGTKPVEKQVIDRLLMYCVGYQSTLPEYTPPLSKKQKLEAATDAVNLLTMRVHAAYVEEAVSRI